MYQEIAYRSPQPKRSNFSSYSIKQEIDSLIIHDMNVLRQGKNNNFHERLFVKQKNELMLDYVKEIYNQYSIDDPLTDVNISRLTSQLSAQKTTKKQKIHLMSNQTLKYSISPRNKTYQDQQNPIHYYDQDQGFDKSRQLRRQIYNNSTIIQESDGLHADSIYRVKNYSLTDLLNNLDDTSRIGKKKRNKVELIIEEEAKVKFQEQVQNKGSILPLFCQQELYQIHNGIQQSFRYCVGCQSAVLHVNIRIHQQTCKQFIAMSELSKEQILLILREKVGKMRERIHEQSQSLLHGDVDQFKQSSLQLINQGRTVAQSGINSTRFEENYNNVIGFGKKWCLISQLGSKIKWFVKVIQNISKSIIS